MCLGGQWRVCRPVEHNLGGALLPDRHEITAKPCLNLTRSRSTMRLCRVQRCARKDVVEVLRDCRRLRKRETVVNQGWYALRERRGREGRLMMCIGCEIY